MSLVSLGDKVIAVGGIDSGNRNSNAMYELTCLDEFSCKWTPMAQNLEIARSNFVAVPIFDELVSCSKSS